MILCQRCRRTSNWKVPNGVRKATHALQVNRRKGKGEACFHPTTLDWCFATRSVTMDGQGKASSTTERTGRGEKSPLQSRLRWLYDTCFYMHPTGGRTRERKNPPKNKEQNSAHPISQSVTLSVLSCHGTGFGLVIVGNSLSAAMQ